VFLVLLNSKLVLANAVACVFHMKLFDSNMSLMTTFDTCVNISIISVILYYLYQSLVRDDQVTVWVSFISRARSWQVGFSKGL